MTQFLRYRNELIVVGALILLLIALAYKNAKVTQGAESGTDVMQTIAQVEEVVSLRNIWADKTLAKKIQLLKTTVAVSKVNWIQKGTKITATYKGLTANELNELGKKLFNMGVQIERFEIRANNEIYEVELVCKW